MASWDDRLDALERHPFHTALKWGLGLIVLFFVLGVAAAALGWIGSWGNEAGRITGPDNTREQYTSIIGDYKELQATAGNVCDAKATPTNASSPTLVEDPAFAYRATYRRIKADYDRRMANAFEAGLIRRYTSLQNYPRSAPGLRAMLRKTC